MRRTFWQAKVIYAKTIQSRLVIPWKYWPKVRCQIEIGLGSPPTLAATPSAAPNKSEFRVLYVGRFLYWKGMHLGLAAFARMRAQYPDARLTIIGQGPEEKRWRWLVEQLEISAQLD